MIPGMSQKKMQQMMKQMGVQQDEIPGARRVEIYTDDAKIVIEPCEVAEVEMMGQKTIQVTGDSKIEALDHKATISDEDIETVTSQTGASTADAKKAIEDADGDLAQAIMNLSE